MTLSGLTSERATPEDLEREGHELLAAGHAKLAAAARRRSTKVDPAGEWIRVDALPIAKRAARAACRSGALRAVKSGRAWLTTRADADAFLRAHAHRDTTPSNDVDEDVRTRLGLSRRSA